MNTLIIRRFSNMSKILPKKMKYISHSDYSNTKTLTFEECEIPVN